jgi:hypothetical protein
MVQLGLVGLSAGAAAALLFVSATPGSWLSIILFYLAPLPIMIAGLGWSHWAAAVAALLGAIAVGTVSGTTLLLTFLVGAGLPAWWLSYLALLARPVTAGPGNIPAPANDSLEWYPAGRLVVWAAFLASLFVVVVLFLAFGTDAEGLRASLTRTMTAALSHFIEANADLRDVNAERLIAFFVATLPPTAAVAAVITNVVNLWLAGRTVKFSGLLKRPWPDMAAIEFPKMFMAALALAFVLSFGGGMLGIVAGVLTSAILFSYAILGLAVLHAITRGLAGRPFILGSIYVSMPLLQGLPILALCILGIAEGPLNLRARAARKRGASPRT